MNCIINALHGATAGRRAVGRAKCGKLYVGTRCKTVDWFGAATVRAASSIARCKGQREEKDNSISARARVLTRDREFKSAFRFAVLPTHRRATVAKSNRSPCARREGVREITSDIIDRGQFRVNYRSPRNLSLSL